VNKKDFAHEHYPTTISKLFLEINKLKEDDIVYSNAAELRKNYCYPQTKVKKSQNKNTAAKLNKLCRSLKFNIISYENAIFLLTGHHQFQKATQKKHGFKNCVKLDDREEVKQVLFANDYSDIGLMMFNSKYHSEFFATGKLFDFDQVIDHGLEYLYRGYLVVAFHNLYSIKQKDALWRKKYGKNYPYHKYTKRLSCFDGMDARTFKGRNFVMRGAWAGRYNSGQVSKSCRFNWTNSSYLNGKFRKNDTNYQSNLAKIFHAYKDDKTEKNSFKLAFSDVPKSHIGSSLFHLYLPQGSIESKAFHELINNVYHGKNDNEFISQVLETNYNSNTNLIAKSTKKKEEPVNITLQTVEGKVLLEVNEEEESLDSDVQETVTIRGTRSSDFDFNEEGIVETSTDLDESVTQISSTEVFQRFNKKKMTHIIIGSEVNIRRDGEYGWDYVCGNTRVDDSQDPIKVEKIGVKGDFTEVKFKNRGKFVYIKGCLELDTFFVYTPQIKEIEDYNVSKIIKLRTFTSIRDGVGSKNTTVLGSIGPGSELKVINEDIDTGTHGKDYIWYQYMAQDGTRPWLFAGVVGERLKVEVIK
jgi:hypothetical protein